MKPALHRPCWTCPQSLSAWSARLFDHKVQVASSSTQAPWDTVQAFKVKHPLPEAYRLSCNHPILSHRGLSDRAAVAGAASAIKPAVGSQVGRELALQGGCTFPRTTPAPRRKLELLSWPSQNLQNPLSKEVYIRKLHWWISCS